MKTRLLLISLSLIVSGAALAVETEAPWSKDLPENKCTAVKEYVTTMEYLKERKEWGLPDLEMRRVAKRISAGCSGSAGRFIKVTSLLIAAQVGPRDAVEEGMYFAPLTDAHVTTFQAVFRAAYLPDQLDMDLSWSVRLAHDLSADYRGDAKVAETDFFALTGFCLSADYLELSKPVCAQLSARLAKHGEGYKSGVASAFREAFDFARSERGPNLTIVEAVKLAEDVVSVSPDSVPNFVQGYKYGIAESGLKLNRRDAVAFAKEMTGLTRAPASVRSGR